MCDTLGTLESASESMVTGNVPVAAGDGGESENQRVGDGNYKGAQRGSGGSHLDFGVVSQVCTHVSKHYIVHLKYMPLFIVNYTSIKLGKNLREENEYNVASTR